MALSPERNPFLRDPRFRRRSGSLRSIQDEASRFVYGMMADDTPAFALAKRLASPSGRSEPLRLR